MGVGVGGCCLLVTLLHLEGRVEIEIEIDLGDLRNKSFVVKINPMITVTNNQARCDNPSHQHHILPQDKETIPNRY